MKRTPEWTIAVAILKAAERPLPFEQRASMRELYDTADDIEFARKDRNLRDVEAKGKHDYA